VDAVGTGARLLGAEPRLLRFDAPQRSLAREHVNHPHENRERRDHRRQHPAHQADPAVALLGTSSQRGELATELVGARPSVGRKI
jgi:hypothetical protein